jgi:hypothetical protein
LGKGVTHHQQTAEDRKQPEHRARALAAAQYAKHSGRQRQQADEHDGVRGGYVLQRQRSEQGETDHHAKGDDGQGHPLRARGAFFLEQPQQGQPQ